MIVTGPTEGEGVAVQRSLAHGLLGRQQLFTPPLRSWYRARWDRRGPTVGTISQGHLAVPAGVTRPSDIRTVPLAAVVGLLHIFGQGAQRFAPAARILERPWIFPAHERWRGGRDGLACKETHVQTSLLPRDGVECP
jgi:hypothetical protein